MIKSFYTIFLILGIASLVNASNIFKTKDTTIEKSYSYNYFAYDKYIKIDYGFINIFLQNEDRVRRLGPDDEGNDYQDANDYNFNPDLEGEEDLRYNWNPYRYLFTSNTNPNLVFEWSSDWFTESQLGIRHYPLHPTTVLIEEYADVNIGPSFLYLVDNFGGFGGTLSFHGPLYISEFSSDFDFGFANHRGTLMGGHEYQDDELFLDASMAINVPFYRMDLVIDRNGITIGSGFIGGTHGSMNRRTYYWGYSFTNLVNNQIAALESGLFSALSQVCGERNYESLIMNTCGMGQDTNGIVQASGLDQNGVPFDGTEGEPDDDGPGRINLLGFRYRISFRIVDGSPQITLHWENHTYLYKGVKVVYRFFDDNHRHPRRLEESFDIHFGRDVTRNSIKVGEKLYVGEFLFSENFRKLSILGKCYLYTFDIPSFTFLSEYKLNECDVSSQ